MNWPLSEVFPISRTYATVLDPLVRSRMTARDARVSTQPMTTVNPVERFFAGQVLRQGFPTQVPEEI